MELTLTVIRCPDSVVPEQRRVPGGDFVIGRGADASWVLPDPDRLLSKHHCVVEFRNGGWQVRDLSTNGTFVNHAEVPVGRDQVKMLEDGDRLRLGAYEIEVHVAQAGAQPGGWTGGALPGTGWEQPPAATPAWAAGPAAPPPGAWGQAPEQPGWGAPAAQPGWGGPRRATSRCSRACPATPISARGRPPPARPACRAGPACRPTSIPSMKARPCRTIGRPPPTPSCRPSRCSRSR